MAHATDKPATERRIHVLPVELLERVRAYQAANAIPSEVEAVRRLLSEALQARDSINDIMNQIKNYWYSSRDLRSISRDVLSSHILVSKIEINDDDLCFALKGGSAGKVTKSGEMYTGREDEQGYLSYWTTWPPSENKTRGFFGAKLPPSPNDLDDEIPF